MKVFKRILSGILATVMALGAASMISIGAANVTFTDVSNHWAWKDGYIPYLVEKGVLNGYEQANGTYMFKPDGQVKRSEFIKMLDETFGLTATTSINFADVKTSDWFYPYFQKAAAQGYLLDYGKNANPSGQITREEAAALLVRYLDLPASEKAEASTFSDYDSISSGYREYVLQAVYAGIIEGYEEGGKTLFKPQKTLSRAEALTILYRAAGCIFNENATYRTGDAADTNNTITKGGISISNVRFNGRNIITEGASNGKITFYDCDINGVLEVRGGADVTFNDCTVENLVLIGGGSISLVSGTTVKNLTISETTKLGINSNTTVENLTVEYGADNSKVTGDGILETAVIRAKNFSSSLTPNEFEIGNNLTATFGNTEYEGTSDDVLAYTVEPFSTSENGYYYINLVSGLNGSVYYYYTNTNDKPSASAFESYYNKAAYYGNFKVTAGDPVSEQTFASGTVGKFRYIVLQFRDSKRDYAPIIVENTVVSDTGFKTEPYAVDELTIKFQAASSATLYWYYAEDGNTPTQIEFLAEYEATSSSLKGSTKVTSNKSFTCNLNEKYVKDYSYVAFMLKNADGTYCVPVVVAIGETGFTVAPSVTTPGEISFKSSISGEIYYYYSKTDELPSPADFKSAYNDAKYGDHADVTKNVTQTIDYSLNYASSYPYMILALKNNSGKFMLPVVLEIDYSTGFRTEPYVKDTTEIRFRPEAAGTVYYYYTKTSTAPAADEFMKAYDKVSSKYSGSMKVAAATSYIEYELDYAVTYPYMAIMFVDNNDKEYCPVVVKLDATQQTGFATNPYAEGTKIYFRAEASGEVWYFYSTDGSTISPSVFGEYWNYEQSKRKGTITVSKGALTSLAFDTDLAQSYPYLIMAFTADNGKTFSFPCILDLTKALISEAGSGLEVGSTFGSAVYLKSLYSGTLYWYRTSDASKLPTSNNQFSSCYSAISSANKNYGTIEANKTALLSFGDNSYIVCALRINSTYLDYVIIHNKDGVVSGPVDGDETEETDSTVPDSDVKNDYGFKYIGSTTSGFTVTAYENGTIKLMVVSGGQTTVLSSVDVNRDDTVSLELASFITSVPPAVLGSARFFIQFTDTNGTTYKPMEVNIY